MVAKIIFLDFDGPLSNARVTMATGDDDAMDPIMIGALNNICAATGAKIVCTSTRTWAGSHSSFQDSAFYFDRAGLDFKHLHPDWSCYYNDGEREGHINRWLAEHPGVTHYVIIDDEQVGLPNFVKVHGHNGPTLAQYEKIAKFLGFRLVDAFNEARSHGHNINQFVLPFEQRHQDSNQDLIDRKP